jgi:UDP-N-acetyl-D-glucosamine dehydrogenase
MLRSGADPDRCGPRSIRARSAPPKSPLLDESTTIESSSAPALGVVSAPASGGGGAARTLRRVGVVGLGYVGLPLAAAYRRAGLSVVGHDVDARLMATLEAGLSPHAHLDPTSWGAGERDGLELCRDASWVAGCDVLSLCLPTPTDAEGRPDLGALRAAAEMLAPRLREGQLVLLHSTVYPGVTRSVLTPILAGERLRPGRDLFVAYSPEREDPGRGLASHAVPRLVGGLCDRSTTLAAEFLADVVDRVHVTESVEVAEAAKLHENVYRAVNIALVSELAEVYRGLGLDPHAVVDAAATKPYGFQAFRPGPGPGGHCIPVDPLYLTAVAASVGRDCALVEASIAINAAEPGRWASRVLERLGGRDGARVLLLGMAYKPRVGDLRDSPGPEIARRLVAAGVELSWCDPYLDADPPALAGLGRRVDFTTRALEEADLVLLVTDHPEFDRDRIRASGTEYIDPRGALRVGSERGR